MTHLDPLAPRQRGYGGMEHPPSAGHGTAFCKLLQRQPSRKTHDATPMGGVIGPASRPAGRSSLASSTSCGRTSLLPSSGVTSHPRMERDALGLPDDSHAIRWCRCLWPRLPACPPLSASSAMAGNSPRTPRFLHKRPSRGYTRQADGSYAACRVSGTCRQASHYAKARGRTAA